MKALLARTAEKLCKLMELEPTCAAEQEIQDNASLTLMSIYKLAEINGWRKIMEEIEATGIDLH